MIVDKITRWPPVIRLAVLVMIFLLVSLLIYKEGFQVKIRTLKRLRQQEIYLLNQLNSEHQQAATVAEYQQQLLTIQDKFKTLLPLLVDRIDITDISQAGIESGLYFQSLQAGVETQQTFYSAVSIDIVVQGEFHQFAEFVSRLSTLPQLITVENFTITPLAGHKPGSLHWRGQDKLVMTMQLLIYRYLATEAERIKK